MKLKKFAIFIAIFSFLCSSTQFLKARSQDLQIGKKPPSVRLYGATGGLANGKDWSSDLVKDKVHLLIYSSPSSKDDNNAANDAIKKQSYPNSDFGSVAIVNMEPSWLPNTVISKAIESKQIDYPRTIFVKDKTRELVKRWGLKDDTNNILIFDRNGQVIFLHKGKLVAIEGRLQTRSYEDKEGQRRKAFEVVADEMQMLDRGSQGGGGGGARRPAQSQAQAPAAAAAGGGGNFNSGGAGAGFPPADDNLGIDDIPF